MKCKFCNAEMEDGAKVCPSCQKNVAESETKTWQLVLGIVAAVVLLGSLALLLLSAFGVHVFPAQTTGEVTPAATVAATEATLPNIDTTTLQASDEEAIRTARDVVASVDGAELTNGLLRLLYRMSVVEYINANYDYLSYLGLDFQKPLSEQVCYEDETISWEQYFLTAAIESWYNYQCVYSLAMEEGFVPSEDLQHSLAELPDVMEEMAAQEGLADGDALIADRFGAGCTVEDYETYWTLYYVSAEYINITPTAQQLEDYYKANEELFVSYGIDKDSGPMVNVRHILVCPEGGTVNETTQQVTYSQDEWDACLEAAELLYVSWKNGEATEESFAALANEKSEDGGSNTNGGLYTGITKETSFVEPFLNWCMDETRKVGDTDIVKTDYGYHIMFFAYTQPQWEYYANTYFLSEYTNTKIEEGREKWPIEIDKDKIVLAELQLT